MQLTDLSQYDNSWYKPGKGGLVRLLWFLVNAAFLRVNVTVVKMHELLPGNAPQPRIESDRPLAEILRKLAMRLHQRLLDDVFDAISESTG